MLRVLSWAAGMAALATVALGSGSTGNALASSRPRSVAVRQSWSRVPQWPRPLATHRSFDLLAPERASANSQDYPDTSGDSGNAPDVTSIHVTNDDRGMLTFTIALSNRPALHEQDNIDILFDVDLLNEAKKTTGFNGADYAFFEDTTGGVVGRWNGSYFGAYSTPSSSSSFANGVLTFSINRRDLGNPAPIVGFVVLTSADAGVTIDEDAPDSLLGGWSVFEIVAPGTTPTLGGKLALGGATSGAPFTATLRFTRSDAANPTWGPLVGRKFTCNARVGGKVLHATARASDGTTVRCTWLLPQGSAGESVTGSIGVAFTSPPWAKLTRAFSRKIR